MMCLGQNFNFLMKISPAKLVLFGSDRTFYSLNAEVISKIHIGIRFFFSMLVSIFSFYMIID